MSLALIKNRHTQRENDPKTTAAFLMVIIPLIYDTYRIRTWE